MSNPTPQNIFTELRQALSIIKARQDSIDKALKLHQRVLEAVVKHLNLQDLNLK